MSGRDTANVDQPDPAAQGWRGVGRSGGDGGRGGWAVWEFVLISRWERAGICGCFFNEDRPILALNFDL